MPIHSKRLKERSFNQSLEIAKVLTKNNSEKLRHSTEKRQRYRPPKVSLLLKERTKNINMVFATNAVLTCKRIAIVDYVMTTGPSLNELAKTLKKASAAHVKC
jgi:predicted amidophosphoribosyltransferase